MATEIISVVKTKHIVVFYSRTGTTKKVAEDISRLLKCDMEEIIDTRERSGFLGHISSGRDAYSKKLTVIKEMKKNPGSYEVIIIGTPVWAHTMSPAVRTYIHQNKDSLKRVAFFCTLSTGGASDTFTDMEVLCGKKPISTLEIRRWGVVKKEYVSKLKEFINKLK